MKWKHFPHNWRFVRRIHQSPVDSLYKGPVMRSFDVSFDVSLKQTAGQPRGRWIKMASIWRWRNEWKQVFIKYTISWHSKEWLLSQYTAEVPFQFVSHHLRSIWKWRHMKICNNWLDDRAGRYHRLFLLGKFISKILGTNWLSKFIVYCGLCSCMHLQNIHVMVDIGAHFGPKVAYFCEASTPNIHSQFHYLEFVSFSSLQYLIWYSTTYFQIFSFDYIRIDLIIANPWQLSWSQA